MDWSLLAFGPSGWGDELWRGLLVTLALAVASYTAGVVLGTLCGLLELGPGRVLPRLLAAYAAVVRSVPELLVIFLVFYGLGHGLTQVAGLLGLDVRISLSPFVAGVIAIAVVIGSYVSEVVKGAVAAVPEGMSEAALSLGLSAARVRRLVILPLALRFAFPGLANLWMVVIKVTPLVSAIQLEDFIRAAGTAGQNTREYFAFFGIVLLVYLLISGASMFTQLRLERRLFRHIAEVRP